MASLKIITTQDGSHTLFNPELDEIYHSNNGAVTESNYVFIEQGFGYYLENQGKRPLNIFELGFGTGLNALCTLNANRADPVKIRYVALESDPVPLEIADNLNYPLFFPDPRMGEYYQSLHQAEWNKEVSITDDFSLLKKTGKIEDYATSGKFQIAYFDAFAPSKQPEIWSAQNLKKIFELLEPSGILVSYCAQGAFKRNLAAVGFEVETLPGPPGKNEMVRGRKVQQLNSLVD